MRPQDRAAARRQLDKKLNLKDNSNTFTPPPRGWVKAIREALGMTAAQLGKRLKVSQQRALAIEKAEADRSVTLESLERTANALDCRLVYSLIPRKSLETLVEERAAMLAKKRLKSTRHTMALEAQSVEKVDETAQLESLIRKLVEESGSALWDEE